MNRPNRVRRKLLPAGALVAPVAVVLILRALGTGYPAKTVAAVTETALPPSDTPEAAVPPAPPLASKAEVERALSWLRAREGTAPARSPMDFEPAVQAAPEAPEPAAPAPSAARPTKPSGPVNLSSVMATEGGALATINGRIVRVGDSLEPGWRVVEIDARRVSVVIEGPEARRLELTRTGLREPR
jgi:hypothetical protein